MNSKKTEDEEFEIREGDITDVKIEGVFDANYSFEQMEAFNYAVKSSCELGFEKVNVFIKKENFFCNDLLNCIFYSK